MRCVFKLVVAIAIAVFAQLLVQPGGVADEVVFTTRVYIGHGVFGIPLQSPEMLNAAARVMERQGMSMSTVAGQVAPARDDETAIAEFFTPETPTAEPAPDALAFAPVPAGE